MNKEKTLIPKLRFPEFKNNGEWEEKKLGEIAKVYQPETIAQSLLKQEGYPVYGANGIIGYFDKYNHKGQQIAIACRGSSCGTVNFTKPKSWITGNAMVVNVDDTTEINKKFLFYFLSSSDFNYLITGTGQPQITSDIKKHIVPIPTFPEQQKIADFLSNLDELIELHKKKLELLKQHKKGLMQKLFPQEGEKIPKLRFPEFQNDGEWEEKKLGDLCFNISSGKDKHQDEGSFDLYGSTGIIGRTKNASFDGNYILVARVGANAGLLNKAVGQFGVTDNTLIINLKEPKQIDFIFYSLYNFGLNRLIFGSGQPLVTGKQLKILNIMLPSIKERQKIASVLSSLDEKITAETKKIELLEKHKKGLMQKIFP